MTTPAFRNKSSSVDLQVGPFWGGREHGVMLQLTQGFGLALDEPGFIQLTRAEVERLLPVLQDWLK